MKKLLGIFSLSFFLLLACSDDDATGVCANATSDFQACLDCCSDEGFFGASLDGNTCECLD